MNVPVRVMVVIGAYCPVCKALMGFKANEYGEITGWEEPTPFRQALSWIVLSGGRVDVIPVGVEETPEKLAVFNIYGPELLLPAALSNRAGVWSPVPLGLTAREYYLVLLGRMPKRTAEARAKRKTFLRATMKLKYLR